LSSNIKESTMNLKIKKSLKTYLESKSINTIHCFKYHSMMLTSFNLPSVVSLISQHH